MGPGCITNNLMKAEAIAEGEDEVVEEKQRPEHHLGMLKDELNVQKTRDFLKLCPSHLEHLQNMAEADRRVRENREKWN